jgi:hypothetical protein
MTPLPGKGMGEGEPTQVVVSNPTTLLLDYLSLLGVIPKEDQNVQLNHTVLFLLFVHVANIFLYHSVIFWYWLAKRMTVPIIRHQLG